MKRGEARRKVLPLSTRVKALKERQKTAKERPLEVQVALALKDKGR